MDTVSMSKFASRKLVWAVILLITLLAAVQSIVSVFSIGDYSKRMEINLDDTFQSGEAKKISLMETDRIREEYPEAEISYSSVEDTVLGFDNNSINIKVFETDFMYMRFLNAAIIKGSYFTYDAGREGRKVAVISEELAGKLFSSYNPIGLYVSLFGGEQYKIVGVYKKSETILSLLASDGKGQIFVPYKSRHETDDEEIRTVFLRDAAFEKQKFVSKILISLLEKMGVGAGSYRINSFYQSNIVLSGYTGAFSFLLGAAVIWKIFTFLSCYLKSRFAAFKIKLENKYFIELISAEKRETLKMLVVTAGSAVIAAAVFLSVRFKLYIDRNIFPPDNIFDIRFYISRITDAVNNANLSSGYLPTQLELINSFAIRLVLAVTFLVITAAFNGISAIRLGKMAFPGKIPVRELAAALVISILISLLVSLLLASRVIIPIKEVIFINIFILLSFSIPVSPLKNELYSVIKQTI